MKRTDYRAVELKKKIDSLESKLEKLDAEERAVEKAFIKEKGLDIESLACLGDDDFDMYSDEYFKLPEMAAIEAKTKVLYKYQKDCENLLLERALSIAPAKLAAHLRNGLSSISVRSELISAYLAYAV
jgi:hypothetical protein